jgi:hypothetical protein
MEMVQLGGHFISITPANNFFGHGFYQFSPEVFYGSFSKENGFVIERLIAFNDRPNRRWRSANPKAQWYAVANPAAVGERVTLSNSHPVSLMVIARKTRKAAIFRSVPQQNDYQARWSEKSAESGSKGAVGETAPLPYPLWLRAAKALIPAPVRFALRKAMSRPGKPMATRFERRFFTPLDPIAEVHRH